MEYIFLTFSGVINFLIFLVVGEEKKENKLNMLIDFKRTWTPDRGPMG